MQLGFVTIPDVIVFALHFSIGSRDGQHSLGKSARRIGVSANGTAIYGVRIVSFYSSRRSDAVDLGCPANRLSFAIALTLPNTQLVPIFKLLAMASALHSYAFYWLLQQKTSPAHDEMEN
jgi:hypothetical protein